MLRDSSRLSLQEEFLHQCELQFANLETRFDELAEQLKGGSVTETPGAARRHGFVAR